MSFAARVARNASILVGTHVITYSISIVVFALLGRHLLEAGLGRFNFISSILNLFFLFCTLGLDVLLIREIATHRDRTGEYLGATLSLKFLLATVVAIFYYSYVALSNEPAEIKQALWLAGLSLWFSSWSSSFQAVFNAHERMVFRGITLLVLNVVQLIGVAVVIALERQLVATILVYHVFGSAAGMLVAALLVRKMFTGFRPRALWSLWKSLLRRSLSFFVVEVAGRVYFVADIVLLRWLLRADDVTGWFSASKKILEAVHLLTSALTQALYPALAHRFASESRQRGKTFFQMSRLILLVALPTGLFMLFCARGIVALIFGLANYEPSVFLLRAFGLVAIVMIYDAFVTYFSYVLHLENSVRRVALGRTFLNLALDASLIWGWGALGGVVATGLSSVFNLSCCLVLIRRTLGPLGLIRAIPKPLLINACFAVTLIPLSALPVLLATPIAGVAYIVLLWVFREIGREELAAIGILRSRLKGNGLLDDRQDL